MPAGEDPRAVIHSALDSEEDALRGALDTVRRGLRQSLRASSGEDSADYQGAALATATHEREKDMGRAELLEHELGQVLAAKDRLAAGAYGRCQACGDRIAPARLAARPQASLCLQCERREEAGGRR
jgi:RNA polymerase-binding transcription factor DksA